MSEVAKLKVPDIDSGRGVTWIRGGKGHKDRQTLLPPKLAELLRVYYRWKRRLRRPRRSGRARAPCPQRVRNASTASGGKGTAMLWARPCRGGGRELTKPPLPTFDPPNNAESVLKISS